MSAYYNEFDPKAAAFLRQLIKEGHIADGDVDERSIEDVAPNELLAYTQVHLFAGYGIWSLAFRWAGIADTESAWSCSCPCQPFSAAGQGKGFADERHLWPAAFHLIQHARRRGVPLYGEQVASSRVMPWIDLVWSDLEATGDTFRAVILASAGFGAPIIRQRTFWVASAKRLGRQEGSDVISELQSRTTLAKYGSEFEWLASAKHDGSHRPRGATPEQDSDGQDGRVFDGGGAVSWLAESDVHPGRSEHEQESRERSDEESRYSAGLGPSSETVGMAGSASIGRERRRAGEEIPAPGTIERLERLCDVGGLGEPNLPGQQGWDSSAGSPDQRPAGDTGLVERMERATSDGRVERRTEPSERGTSSRCSTGRLAGTDGGESSDGELQRSGQHGLVTEDGGVDDGDRGPGPTNGHWRDADWLRCRDALWRPVESGTFPLAHGDSERVGRLRGYGNAISPQVAAEFIKAHREAEGIA